MTHTEHRVSKIFAGCCAALFLFAVLLTILPSATAAAARDGVWKFQLTTQVGKCAPNIVAAFSLHNGEINTAAGGTFKADGVVERNGKMWVRLTRGRDKFRIQGTLRGARASGSWSSNTRLCGGIWRGAKRK